MPDADSKRVSEEPTSQLNSHLPDDYSDPKASHQKQNGHSFSSAPKSYAAVAKIVASKPVEVPKPKEIAANPPPKEKRSRSTRGSPQQSAKPAQPRSQPEKSEKVTPTVQSTEPVKKTPVVEEIVQPANLPQEPQILIPQVKSFAAVAKNGIVAAGLQAGAAAAQSSTRKNSKPLVDPVKPMQTSSTDPKLSESRKSNTNSLEEHSPNSAALTTSKPQTSNPNSGSGASRPPQGSRFSATSQVQNSSGEVEEVTNNQTMAKLENVIAPHPPTPKSVDNVKDASPIPAAKTSLKSPETSAVSVKQPEVASKDSSSPPARPKSSPLAVNAPEFIPSIATQKVDANVAKPVDSPNRLDSSGVSSVTSSAMSNGSPDASLDTSHQSQHQASSNSELSRPTDNESKVDDGSINNHFSSQQAYRPTFQAAEYFNNPSPMPYHSTNNGYPANSALFFQQPITTEIETRNGRLLVNPLLYPVYNNGMSNGHHHADSDPHQNNNGKHNGDFDLPNARSPPHLISPMPSIIKSFYFTTSCGNLLVGRNGHFLADNVEIWMDEEDSVAQRQGFSMLHIHGLEQNVDLAVAKLRGRLENRGETLQAVSSIQSPDALHPAIMQLDLPEGVILQAFVATVEAQGVIFLQMPGHPTFLKLNSMEDHLNRYCSNPDTPFIDHRYSNIDVGCYIAAPVYQSEENAEKWVRAKVISAADENGYVQLRALDHGWVFTTSLTSLKPLPEFCFLPIQAIESRVLLGRYDGTRNLTEQINRCVDSAIARNWVKVRAVTKEYDLWPVVEMWLPTPPPNF